MSVALFASSTALVSESLVRLPCFSVSPIDESDDVHDVIAEQSPSAHSVVGDALLLLSSLEPPHPAANRAATTITAAAIARLGMLATLWHRTETCVASARCLYRPNSALTRPTSTAVFSAA